jgi:phospholipid-binding lipoprotein MlaA
MTGLSKKWFKRALLTASAVAFVSSPLMAETNPNDPYEGFNRTMFSVNEVVDSVIAKPLAKGYDAAVPLPVKASVGNMFGNAGDLWIGANDAMQGKLGDAGVDFSRLLINSTLGIFGLFDVASELGFDKHEEDFGQTLAVWGVRDGGYLFWPVIGPRTVRDTAGFAVDSSVDPVRRMGPVSARNSMLAVRLVDVRASLLPADKIVEEAAIDKYAYIRDAYLQRRRNQIFDGRPPRLEE